MLKPFGANSGVLATSPDGSKLLRESWDVFSGQIAIQWWLRPSGQPLADL